MNPMAFLSDRRKHPRYPINLPVLILYAEKRAAAHTLDIGLGGMKIYTDKVFSSQREFLFQLVLQRKSLWVKGRFVFEQTQPEMMKFSCIQFEEARSERIFDLQEFLSHLQNDRGKRLRMTVQGLDDCIEALLLAITDGLKNIHLLLEKGNVADQTSFDRIIFSIQNNYKEIRRVLGNLGPSISEELEILASVGRQCQELREIYYGIQNEKEKDLLEDSGSGEIQYVPGR
jgi:PilZ domain